MAPPSQVHAVVLVRPSPSVPPHEGSRRAGWGALRLTTIGRRSGRERSVMIGYFEDGSDLITMTMNGWGEGEPAWWLNLQAHPEASVHLVEGSRRIRARTARGEERERLWSRWREIDKNLDAYAARRSTETTVVIMEPRPSHDEVRDPRP